MFPRPDANSEQKGSVHVAVLLNFFDELRATGEIVHVGIANRDPHPKVAPSIQKALLETIEKLTESPELRPHDEHEIEKLSYVTMQRRFRLRKEKRHGVPYSAGADTIHGWWWRLGKSIAPQA